MAFEIFALIFEETVKNIVVGGYYDCDQAAKATYGSEAFAVEVTYIPVAIEDRYEDGVFKRLVDGEWVIIEPVPTEKDRIAKLEAENATLSDEVSVVMSAVLDIVEAENG